MVKLAKIWDLAQRFLMPSLQNHAMDLLHKTVVGCNGRCLYTEEDYIEFLKFVDEVEDRDNAIARFGLEVLMASVHYDWVDKVLAEIPPKMGRVLLVAMRKMISICIMEDEVTIPIVENFYVKRRRGTKGVIWSSVS
jgi:hypothetical protein